MAANTSVVPANAASRIMLRRGWDSDSVCYSCVFRWKDAIYMLYCGNHYGRDGLGLAVLRQ